MRLHTTAALGSLLGLAWAISSASAQLWSVESTSVRTSTVEGTMGPPMSALGTTLCREKAALMVVDDFSFLRANNPLYYTDLKNKNVVNASAWFSSKANTWLQGDMHMNNMGSFDNDQGKVVFDANDFDESWVANFLYDVYRLSTSVVLVARANGLGDTDAATLVKAFATKYMTQLGKFVGNNDENAFDWGKNNAYGILDNFLIDAENNDSRKKMLDKYSFKVSGTRTFMSTAQNPDLGPVTAAERSSIVAAMAGYAQTLTSGLKGNSAYFAVQDVARRLNAGLGSYGVTRYYVIVEGATTDADDDRILDVKLQSKPAINKYAGVGYTALNIPHDGQRVITGQKEMLPAADNHLGWLSLGSGAYSVRERSPFKESLTLTGLSLGQLTNLCEQYGIVLAATHARADQKASYAPDAPFESVAFNLASTASRQAAFASDMATFAISYANQVAADRSIFTSSYNAGRICP